MLVGIETAAAVIETAVVELGVAAQLPEALRVRWFCVQGLAAAEEAAASLLTAIRIT